MSLLQSRLQAITRPQPVEDQVNIAPVASARQVLWRQVKDRAMQEAVDVLDVDIMERMSGTDRDAYLQKEVSSLVDKTLQAMDVTFSRAESLRMVREVVSEIAGYGPITPLLADDEVNEIMVNGLTKFTLTQGEN